MKDGLFLILWKIIYRGTKMRFIAILLMLIITSFLVATEKPTVTIFYKQRKPSLEVKVKLDSLLINYQKKYDITYYDIEDSVNLEVIKEQGLPETHFPIAVLVNGKFNAKIGEESISFIHFPLFMQGIGRHEGNWSMNHLIQVLENSSLMIEDNTLPVHDEKEETSACED